MKKTVSKHDIEILWTWIIRTYEAMDKARAQELSKYNINHSQGFVLAVIHDLGGEATLTQIGQRSFRKINTVSEIVSRMEKEGLVKRVKDLKQKNWIRIILTEKGIKASLQADKRESIMKIMSCLTEKECHQLTSCCRKLSLKALEEMGIEPDKDWPL